MALPIVANPSARPLVLTIICVIGFLLSVGYLGLHVLIQFERILDGLFLLAMIPRVLLVLAFVGYWQQKRWGFIVAVLTLPAQIITKFLSLSSAGLSLADTGQFILLGLTSSVVMYIILCGIGVYYWKRLR